MLVAFRQRPTGPLRHLSRRIPSSSKAALDLEVIQVIVSQEHDRLCTGAQDFLTIASRPEATCSLYKTLIVHGIQHNKFYYKSIILNNSLKQGFIAYVLTS